MGLILLKATLMKLSTPYILRCWLWFKKEKKGKALKKLKDKKEALLTARALVGTVHKTREAAALLTEHEVSLNGFDIVKSRIDEALDSLHRKGLAMVQEGENGKALQMLQNKKEALLTAHALVGIIQKAGEALEGYIQTYPEVLAK